MSNNIPVGLDERRQDRFDLLFGPGRTPSQRHDEPASLPDGDTVILLLNDGETYTGIHGCVVALIPDDYFDEHDDFESPELVVANFTLTDPYLDRPLPTPPDGCYLVAVLNDGETVSVLHGCTVMAVPDEDLDDEDFFTRGRLLKSF